MARILVTGASGFIGKNLLPKLTDHEVVECDICTQELTGPFDGIIHLAAVSRVRDGEADRIKCLETNIMLTARMLEWNPKWFIYAGTCEQPANTYGFSKRVAEDYIKLRAPKYIIYRLSNVYGPGMAEDKLLPRLKRGEIKTLDDTVLPFEHVPVSVVVEMIRLGIDKFEEPAFKSFTLKLAAGVAKTREQLESVAASY